MLVAAVDWTNVLVALIAGLPAIIAACYGRSVKRSIRTPSGDSIGHVVERAHETSVANNLLLARANGETQSATPRELRDASPEGPQIPAEPPDAPGAPQ